MSLALIWVSEENEGEITEAFQKALVVRDLGPEARSLADYYFFETLVRVHRAGEGAPYTGLKPAGRNLGPAIPAADRALETESLEDLLPLVSSVVEEGIRERFRVALRYKSATDVAGGRQFVAAYVAFLHYVEHLFDAPTISVEGHP